MAGGAQPSKARHTMKEEAGRGQAAAAVCRWLQRAASGSPKVSCGRGRPFMRIEAENGSEEVVAAATLSTPGSDPRSDV